MVLGACNIFKLKTQKHQVEIVNDLNLTCLNTTALTSGTQSQTRRVKFNLLLMQLINMIIILSAGFPRRLRASEELNLTTPGNYIRRMWHYTEC